MCTGEPLFLSNDEDNIDTKNMKLLFEWPEWLKLEKLAKITNTLARNLVSQLLSKLPLKRPATDKILDHPFLSGKKAARLVGEQAEFDVFLSYRVSSDAMHVELLYNALTSLGLKVW